MTCRDEVLAAFARLERRHGREDFELLEIVQEVLAHTDEYAGELDPHPRRLKVVQRRAC